MCGGQVLIALEEKVRHCTECQEHQRLPSKAPLHPWDWPEKQWARVLIDFAGPFLGRQFLLLVDAHPKWLEMFTVPSTSSQAAIDKLHEVFITHRLPEILVSDNGPTFNSDEFPSTNSQAAIEKLHVVFITHGLSITGNTGIR